eukprot:365117-Chlamydomonas_euryale.AAC.8
MSGAAATWTTWLGPHPNHYLRRSTDMPAAGTIGPTNDWLPLSRSCKESVSSYLVTAAPFRSKAFKHVASNRGHNMPHPYSCMYELSESYRGKACYALGVGAHLQGLAGDPGFLLGVKLSPPLCAAHSHVAASAWYFVDSTGCTSLQRPPARDVLMRRPGVAPVSRRQRTVGASRGAGGRRLHPRTGGCIEPTSGQIGRSQKPSQKPAGAAACARAWPPVGPARTHAEAAVAAASPISPAGPPQPAPAQTANSCSVRPQGASVPSLEGHPHPPPELPPELPSA